MGTARRCLKSVLCGLAAAIAAGMAAFAMAPFFDAVGLYIAPAAWLVPLVGPIISRPVGWLMPEGGPAAGVLFILICTISFRTVLFAVAQFAWSRSRRHEA